MDVSSFLLQWQSRVVVSETEWPIKAESIHHLVLYRKSLPTRDLGFFHFFPVLFGLFVS